MDGTDALTIEIAGELANVAREDWDSLANPADAPYDPFLSWDFLQALEESGCASTTRGWQPAHLVARDATRKIVGAMPLYAKDHSYGEYVFDHAWADALIRAGGRYYPKLQCAVPFTPVPGRRIFARDAAVEGALAQGAIGLAQRAGASSVHVTFASGELGTIAATPRSRRFLPTFRRRSARPSAANARGRARA
jgi:uncharacterized protein